MTIKRLTLLTTLVTAVMSIGTSAASAQENVKIAIPATYSLGISTDFIITTAVVDGTYSFTSSCMQEKGFGYNHSAYQVVAIEVGYLPMLAKSYMTAPIPAGTRLINIAFGAQCVDDGTTFNVYSATIASPQNAEMAFAITPAGVTLTAGHEAVIGAGCDEFGIADAICVKQGEKSFQTELISDIPLETGDRLTEFVEVDFDPATGETMYACWLEY